MLLKSLNIDSTWTLFLDRDGVINVRLVDDYVKSVDEFEFIEGVKEAIAEFSQVFNHIFVVTNQQGIGKGLMSETTLKAIHEFMVSSIKEVGGNIDKIYYCPHLREENSKYRKPEIGMALHAKKDFPDIHFKKSIMVGDTINDMKFGKHAGMFTVLISDDVALAREHPKLIDFRYKSLLHLAQEIRNS